MTARAMVYRIVTVCPQSRIKRTQKDSPVRPHDNRAMRVIPGKQGNLYACINYAGGSSVVGGSVGTSVGAGTGVGVFR